MKNKINYSLLLFSLIHTLFSAIEDANITTVNIYTKKINRRFYGVQKLKKMIKEILKNKEQLNSLIPISGDCFLNEKIKYALYEINKNQNWQCFKNLWKDFMYFRYLHDPDFEQNYIQLTNKLYKKLHSHNNAIRSSGLEELAEISIDDVMFNFYINRRRDAVISLLQDIPFDNLSTELEFSKNNHLFSNKKIKQCIESMNKKQSVAPLVESIKSYKQYRHTGDYDFLKEQLSLIFLVYRNMMKNSLSLETEAAVQKEMQFIDQTCDNLQSYSIDQLLDLIDTATNRLILIRGMQEKSEEQGLLDILASKMHGFFSYFIGG